MIKSIALPRTIKVVFNKYSLTLNGPEDKINIEVPKGIQVKLLENEIRISVTPKDNSNRLLGTFYSNLRNTIKGLQIGFTQQLNLVGIGYRVEKLIDGSLSLKLGYSNPVLIEKDPRITLEVIRPNVLQIKGLCLQHVTQKAAEIRKLRLPEPYKGKGILFKKERILRKEGKKIG
jgi:large subunit ribosomal protein L6